MQITPVGWCLAVDGGGALNTMDCKLDSAMNRLWWQRGPVRHATAWHRPLDQCQSLKAVVGGLQLICCSLNHSL